MTGTESNQAAARNDAIKQICNRPARKISYPTKTYKNGTESPAKVSDFFGCNVYGLHKLKETLSKPVYNDLLEQMSGKKIMSKQTADTVAHAVKVWAIEQGATHFTHWFQPLTNSTAEKHDSFLSLEYSSEGGNLNSSAIDAFSGSQLLQAEPDASSFPNGGIRTTFEARGYTVWDTTSPMFLQEGPHNTKILYIPSIFISYHGDALDEKTILLRSCENLSKVTLDLLKLLGDEETKNVHVTLGTEQEFFLVDRVLYNMRPDLKLTGRTIVGDIPAKHQQLEDHYFGHIPSRVLAAISEAELELWKLGVPVKTRHNEVAPQQFEIAPIFEEASVAVDHNLLTMEIIHKVAHRHGLKALFHEKPFNGVNGSGKHCNWAMSTDLGKNLLEPSAKPEKNQSFLLILCSILLGLKRHSSLLSASISSSANDHRLGANEAPPSIISAFLGAQLNEVLDSIEQGKSIVSKEKGKKLIKVGGAILDVNVAHLPEISRDSTDRNRTSPFAFTGNKFEFRAVGSSQSPSFPVTMLNAATASALEDIVAMLKEKKGAKQSLSEGDIFDVIKKLIGETKIIRFEGDGYGEAWVKEALARGLKAYKNAPETYLELLEAQNKNMLVDKLEIFGENEISSRFNILCERYSKDLLIEAKILKTIACQMILPNTFKYRKDLAAGLAVIAQIENQNDKPPREKKILHDLNTLSDSLYSNMDKLDESILKVEKLMKEEDIESIKNSCKTCAIELKPQIEACRIIADDIEKLLADDYYPMPKYSEILFC